MEIHSGSFEHSTNGEVVFRVSCKAIHFRNDERVNGRSPLTTEFERANQLWSLGGLSRRAFLAEHTLHFDAVLSTIFQTDFLLKCERRAKHLLVTTYSHIDDAFHVADCITPFFPWPTSDRGCTTSDACGG